MGVRVAAATASLWGHHSLAVQHHSSPPPHTPKATIKLMSFPAFLVGSSFFPQASQKCPENTAAEEISFASSALLFLRSFPQLLFSPHLPLSLKPKVLSSFYTCIHILSTFPHVHCTDSGSWRFILASHRSACCPFHTSIFCYHNLLLLLKSLHRTDICLNSLNIN